MQTCLASSVWRQDQIFLASSSHWRNQCRDVLLYHISPIYSLWGIFGVYREVALGKRQYFWFLYHLNSYEYIHHRYLLFLFSPREHYWWCYKVILVGQWDYLLQDSLYIYQRNRFQNQRWFPLHHYWILYHI